MGATALQDSPEPRSIDAAKMTPAGSAAGEPVEPAATVGPTESEIAAAAYQLWLDNGCRVGSDREDWFGAEAALRARRDTSAAAEMVVGILVEIQCWGHWEVWEMEWGDPHWVWDSPRASSCSPNRH
jgi:hypothetical protein